MHKIIIKVEKKAEEYYENNTKITKNIEIII